MARKNVVSVTTFDTVNAVINQSSDIHHTSEIDYLSMHCKFSAANSGTFIVYGKNHDKADWYELDFGAPLVLSSQSECQIVLTQIPCKYLKLEWVPTGGSGTLTVYTTMKSVGA